MCLPWIIIRRDDLEELKLRLAREEGRADNLYDMLIEEKRRRQKHERVAMPELHRDTEQR